MTAAAEAARAELLGEDAAAAFAALGLRTSGGELDERYREGYGVDAEPREAEALVADGVTAGLDAWAVAGRRDVDRARRASGSAGEGYQVRHRFRWRRTSNAE